MTAPSNPSAKAIAVTPSDTTSLLNRTYGDGLPRALYVGTGGDVNIQNADGATVVFSNVPTGAILPVRALRVYSTSTTASNIVALY